MPSIFKTECYFIRPKNHSMSFMHIWAADFCMGGGQIENSDGGGGRGQNFYIIGIHLLQCFQKKYTSEFGRLCCNFSKMNRQFLLREKKRSRILCSPHKNLFIMEKLQHILQNSRLVDHGHNSDILGLVILG